MTANKNFEVIIIGGSYAGLSAAMALGRALRSVLILDGGLPCNRQTPYSHNFLTRDGEKPADIAAKAKAQVLQYSTVAFLNGFAQSGKKTDKDFVITTHSGQEFSAQKLLFATGVLDSIPEIEGFKACWGISVIHCPFCHGYEVRKEKTGILANGERAFHLASLVNNLTDDLLVLTNGKAEFTPEQLAKLDRWNIKIIEASVSEIAHESGHIKAVVFEDGSRETFQTLYAGIPFLQHSDIPLSLGCELTPNGHLKIDTAQKTTVDGVFACGDNSAMVRSVASAVYSGNLAGAMINKELTDERF